MKATSRSVNAIRKADEGNHRITCPHAMRPGMGREKDDDERSLCLYRLSKPRTGLASKCNSEQASSPGFNFAPYP